MEAFDACVQPDAKPVLLDRYLSVYAAVDASVKRDSTAIVAVSWSAKDQCVRLINHKIIQPSASSPVDFEASIERTLLDWRQQYNLICCCYDPYQMVSSAQRLTKEGVMMFEFPQTVPNLTEASQNLFDLIKGGNIQLYPNEEIRLAVSRAIAIETPRGWRIGKDKQAHKVDVVIALAMACLAATKREVTSPGYSLAVWQAACDMVEPAPVDLDGSREWRDKRCPPSMSMETWIKLTGATRPTFGPDAPGAVSLGNNGYRAATLQERWQIASPHHLDHPYPQIPRIGLRHRRPPANESMPQSLTPPDGTRPDSNQPATAVASPLPRSALLPRRSIPVRAMPVPC
jgi:hypothetical protein